MFLRQYQRQRKCFLSERELKKALRDTLTPAAWLGTVIFDWFVLRMRMQVILARLLAPVVRKPISANPRLNCPNARNKFVLRLNSVPRSSISTIQGVN